MEWFDRMGDWMGWLWAWIDWVWAAAWVLAGILLTHLLWWRRSARLADREKKIVQSLATLENRQREVRKLTEDLARREGTIRKMEETLKVQTEQLKPQINQVRSWLDRILHSETDRSPGREPPPLGSEQPVGKSLLN